jgi:hypothetical protein
MASNTQLRSILSAVLSLLIASTLALGLVPTLTPKRPVGAADMLFALTVIADNPVITAGDAIGFTITLASSGIGEATDVRLVIVVDRDTPALPPTWTETTNNPACVIGQGWSPIFCRFGTISAGAPPIVLHITAPTTQQDCGVIETSVEAYSLIAQPVEFSGVSSARVTIICPTATPAPTAPPLATPIAFVPTSTAPAGPVVELPATGGGPDRRSGQHWPWLLVALLVVAGVGIRGLHARRPR